jgi:hypothetical protein
MMLDSTKRLSVVMRDGNLRVADLGRWFDRPYPTVRGWIMGGQVGGTQGDINEIHASLMRLEFLVKNKRGFPVPRLSPVNRIKHIKKARQG